MEPVFEKSPFHIPWIAPGEIEGIKMTMTYNACPEPVASFQRRHANARPSPA
jgi:hypothetical protein